MKLLVSGFLVSVFLFSHFAFTQSLSENEVELKASLDQLRAAKNNAEKNKYNAIFKSKLEESIQLEGAFDYPFASLKTLGSIKSPDNAFRFFNWNVEQDDLTQKYYCYILYFDARMKKYKTIELKDNSFMLPHRPSDILDAENWYGALYYKIIPITRSGKTIYTLLGWDGNTSMSNVKVIDVLSFGGNSVKLGSPIFKNGKETVKRVFFEYAKKTTMFLNYEEQYNRIMFDHLAPETAALTGMYSTYVPDLSYDAYVLKDGKWILNEDVVGVNKSDAETIVISFPDENGEIKEKKIKNKWEEPSKSHVATTPEEQMKEQAEAKSAPPKTVEQKGRQQPQSYNPVSGKKKKRK